MDQGDGPVIVIGAGGHAKVVIEALRAMGRMVVGLVALAPAQTRLLGVPVIGDDDILPRLRATGITQAALGLGDNRLRDIIAARLLVMEFDLPPVLHPAAWISPSCVMGLGAVVLQKAVVSAEAVIGLAAIINSGAIIEHDGVIAEAAHVAPGCVLAGQVRVGARTLMGVGSVVRPRVTLGADVIVGAGSVVVADVPDGLVIAGCPARPLKRDVPIPRGAE
jgi:UDP-perosamine 4-acetyltransferase